MILNFTLPWQKLTDESGVDPAEQSIDRKEIKTVMDASDPPGYFKSLLSWPILSFIFLMILAIGLIVLDLVPNLLGVQRLVQCIVLLFVAYFGFLLALTGFRGLGRYLLELWSSGKATYHLHVVPYLNLVLGVVIVGAAVWLLRGTLRFFLDQPSRGLLSPAAFRMPILTALTVVGTLVLLPLLPMVVEKDEGADTKNYHGEGFLEASKEGGGEAVQKPGKDLGWVRLMLWITLFLSIPAAAFAILERSGRLPLLWGTLTQIFLVAVVPIIISVVYTILLYVHLPKMGGEAGLGLTKFSLSFNWFAPLAVLALGWLWVNFFGSVTLPFFQRMNAQQRVAMA